jgi:uncharacterized protein (TIGR03083 family)
MDVAALIDNLEHHGRALGDAAEHAGLDAAVPTCPEWDVRTLLGHVGLVHRWAATHVRDGKAAFNDGSAAPDFPAPHDAWLIEWYRDGHSALVDALRAAPDDLDAMTFLANDGPARHFWARRQAHETTIHRVDAEAAADHLVPDIDRDFALDGIGELLEGFFGRRGGKLLADPAIAIRIAPSDAAPTWLVEIGAEQRVITRNGDTPADCTLRGAACDLYVDLWNRRPSNDVVIDGDARVVERWRRLARVQWR